MAAQALSRPQFNAGGGMSGRRMKSAVSICCMLGSTQSQVTQSL